MIQMSKQYITASAYLGELDLWEASLKDTFKRVTLVEKAADLTPTFRKDIQILVTEIQTELLKYRREKCRITSLRQDTQPFTSIIQHYDTFTGRVNAITQQVTELTPYTTNRSVEKRTLDKQSRSRVDSVKKHTGITNTKAKVVEKSERLPAKSFQETKQTTHSRKVPATVVQSGDGELRLQFVSLKNNLQQIHKLLDTHDHPLMEQQINKLKLSNAKILMDLKVLKEEHAYMQNQIFEMKREIQEQKKRQPTTKPRYRELQERADLSKLNTAPEWVKTRVSHRL